MLEQGVSAGAVLALVSVLGACGSGRDVDPRATSQAALAAADTTTSPTLTFSANWSQVASGPLVAGQPVEIAYDPARLASQCGGSATSPGTGGGFAWEIFGYYAVGGAAPASFRVSITSAWASGNAVFTPPAAGDLQMWFECDSTTDQTGWDSAYGQNYHFTVQPPVADAGSDAGAPTGTVVVQVLGDAVQGNEGSLPPDQIVSTPIANVLVYDGLWEAGNPLGETDANGNFTGTLTLGVHSIGVMEMTTDESMFSSDGNTVTVTTTPGHLVIHVVPDTVSIQAAYDAGVGNAIYITGETSELGAWATAYKLTYNTSLGYWQYGAHLHAGAQYKLVFAPWTDASTLPLSAPGVRWESGANRVVPSSVYSVLDLAPSF